MIDSSDSIEDIFKSMQLIEKRLEKNITSPKGPRTIDLDLLLTEPLSLSSLDLIIPHPSLHKRRFVLEPLCELIDKEQLHPTLNESFGSLLKKTMDQSCTKTNIVL
mgnify:FL=1